MRAVCEEYRVDECELSAGDVAVLIQDYCIITQRKQQSWQGAQSVRSALHSQAIDEQVEREESPCGTLDGRVTLDRGVADTHAEVLLHTSLLVFTARFTCQTHQ